MSEEQGSFDVDYMVKRLCKRAEHSQGTVLVLGARAGRLFHSNEFYETLKQFGDPSFSDLPRTKQFEACYRIITRHFDRAATDKLLTDTLSNVRLTEADIVLAALVKLKVFDVIISTNIGSVLEQSLEYVGMKEQEDFIIYDQDINEEGFHADKKGPCQIIKVFGQLSTRKYAIKRNAYLSQNKSLARLLSEKLRRDTIIIGLDPVWDAEIYQAFHPQGDSCWYINEGTLDESAFSEDVAKARNIRYFVREDGSYAHFVKTLYWQYIETMPASKVLYDIVFRELRQLRDEINKLRDEISKRSSSNE
jgi:hypothetical protein